MTLSPRLLLGAAMLRACDPPGSQAGTGGIAPYLGAILRGLIRREMTDEMRAAFEAVGMKPTIGVTRDGVLVWDPTFVASCTVEELALVLIHEALHVAFKHAERADAMAITPDPRPDNPLTEEMVSNAHRWNVACDCAINQEIRKIGTLPNAQMLAFPERYGMPAGLIAEEYYRRLSQNQPKSQGQGQGQQGNGKTKAGNGHCGGIAGRPLPGEAPGKSSADGRSDAELERMRRATAEAVREYAGKKRGDVPDGLARWADEVLKPAKIAWQDKLAHSVRNAVAYKTGAVDYTWGRVSRRQAGIGFGPGRPVVPALHAPIPQVAVVIDTSGSMSEKDLNAALSEVQGVLSAVGASVTLVVCDATVHGITPIKHVSQAIGLLKGGGGTAMAPALAAVEKLQPKPSVCIVMTDGEIDDPPKPSFSTVWCIIGRNSQFTSPYGEVVFVEEEREE